MPVNTVRKDYAANVARWQKCRDVYAGSDAVKARGTAYLPALSTESLTPVSTFVGASRPYDGYLMRALFYNATKRTVQGLSGAVFRQPPRWEGVPSLYEDQLADLTLTRQSFAQVARDVFAEMVTVGRVGILLDMPAGQTSQARPYWVFYNAEQIINWRTERRGGDELLTRVILKESIEVPDPDDPYALKEVEQYRELTLEDKVCVIRVYRDEKQSGTWQLVADGETLPQRRGQPLPFIPFLILGAHYVGPEVDSPPLEDLVDVNLSHFRSSADLEHGRHWTALPTPWVACNNTSTSFLIGGSAAWNLGLGGQAGMLEFTGQGLGALEKALEEKRQMMAVLGARLLESEPASGSREAAETVRLRHSGDSSVLRILAETLQEGLQQVLRWHLFWAGADESVVDTVMVGVNQEFLEERLDGNDLQALMLAWQNEGISWSSLFFNLQRGGIVPPGVTEEQEQALVLSGLQDRLREADARQAAVAKQRAAENPNPPVPADQAA